MRKFIPPDPECEVSTEHCAVVHVPRRSRDRFGAGSVTLYDSEEAARAAADPERNLRAAIVMGPSKSSEGQTIYYLVRWL